MRWVYVVLFLLVVAPASAHVGYVLNEAEIEENAGFDFPYLADAFTTVNVLLMLGTLLLVGFLVWWVPQNNAYIQEVHHIVKQAKHYQEFVPWIARLGVGIALIGAGSATVLVTPTLSTWSWLATIEILIGFLLLAGLLTGIAAWGAFLLFPIGILQSTYLVGNLDYLALTIIIIVLGSGKPGVDDLFGIPFFLSFEKLKAYVPFILRVGIGVGMTYLALFEKLLNPHLSQLVVERYELQSVIPVSFEMWVLGAGLVELGVALLLLFGIKTRTSAAVAFLVLSLSFFYFGEAVYSHITLFATLSILFITGGGELSLDKWWKKRLKPIK